MALKLHLGCGTNKLTGWVNVDSVAECHPDLVHDVTTPLPYADLTVDEILAEDILEHFDKYLRFIVFEDWARVLKIGGKITLQGPNFKKILFRYFKCGYDNFVDFIFGENMWRAAIYLGHFGNHKWGYSEKSLRDFIQLFGIKPLDVRATGLNLRLTGRKERHVTPSEIDQIEIYSHANKTGQGKPTLPFGFVRQKMKLFLEQG